MNELYRIIGKSCHFKRWAKCQVAVKIKNDIWLYGEFQLDGDSRYNRAEVRTTTNNSSYSYAHSPYCFIDDSGSSGAIYSDQHTSHLFDVTDTSTHKCRIDVEVQNGSVQTWMMKVSFVRYGDT